MKKTFLGAVILTGAVGLAGGAAWSQEAPGETRQPNRGQARPGEQEGIPGMRGGGTQELSTRDMQAVQQVLKDKGYKVTVDGTANDATRAAIRKFQQDEGLAVTGMVDEPTANRLGFQVRSQNPSDARPRSSGQPGSYQPGTGRPGANNPEITEPKPGSTGGRQESTDANPK